MKIGKSYPGSLLNGQLPLIVSLETLKINQALGEKGRNE